EPPGLYHSALAYTSTFGFFGRIRFNRSSGVLPISSTMERSCARAGGSKTGSGSCTAIIPEVNYSIDGESDSESSALQSRTYCLREGAMGRIPRKENCMSNAGDIPRPEYPRPTFVRSEWLNLNGEWEFEFDDADVGRAQKWFNGRPLSRT